MKSGFEYSSDPHRGAVAWIRRVEAVAVAVATLASCAVAFGQMHSAASVIAGAAVHDGNVTVLGGSASQQVDAVSGQTAGQTSGGQELPSAIDASIPDDATLISKSVAVTDDGTALDAQTGEEITDATIIGTQDTPPDPLVATGGTHYTPLPVGEARQQIADETQGADAGQAATVASAASDTSVASDDVIAQAAEGIVAHNASYQGNPWGAYWKGSTIYNHNGSAAVQNANFVIDVSQFQGTINWAAVKAAGVQGAIIRVGYGWDNPMDPTAAYNIAQCKALGIPFGVYLYSYAATAAEGAEEGRTVARYLHQLGLTSANLAYPIYYDLENWNWTGHAPSKDPNVNASIVRSFVSALSSAGYSNVSVYSYTDYLNTALNSSYIHSLTTWVAQYGAKLQYSSYGSSASGTAYKGWQYSDCGSISGISGNVDLDAFSTDSVTFGTTYRLYNPYTGEHFYTLNGGERAKLITLGWRDEGIAWVASSTTTVPVYRLYNPNAGEHHYTMSLPEKNMLVVAGWRYEGVAWYSDPKRVVPIYRVYNPHAWANGHLFTVDANEASMLAKAGWNREGIGWYAAGL